MIVNEALNGITLKLTGRRRKVVRRHDLKRANFCRFFGSATGLTGQ
jgi:hypothetical protein